MVVSKPHGKEGSLKEKIALSKRFFLRHSLALLIVGLAVFGLLFFKSDRSKAFIPNFSITPPEGITILEDPRGKTLSQTVTIRNTGTTSKSLLYIIGGDNNNFIKNSQPPAGNSTPNITLAAGQTATITFDIVVPAGQASGAYDLYLKFYEMAGAFSYYAAYLPIKINIAGVACPPVFSDDFGDGNANGWTSAYTSSIDGWSVISRSGNFVYNNHPSGWVYSQVKGTTTTSTNYQLTSTMKVNSYDTHGLLFNYQNNQNFWRLAFTGGTASFRGQVGGAWVDASGSSIVSFTPAVGATYNLKLQVEGANFRAKWWKTSEAEPGDWSLSVSESRLSNAGAVGLIGRGDTDYDNFALTDLSSCGGGQGCTYAKQVIKSDGPITSAPIGSPAIFSPGEEANLQLDINACSRANSVPPSDIALVADISGSMNYKWNNEKPPPPWNNAPCANLQGDPLAKCCEVNPQNLPSGWPAKLKDAKAVLKSFIDRDALQAAGRDQINYTKFNLSWWIPSVLAPIDSAHNYKDFLKQAIDATKANCDTSMGWGLYASAVEFYQRGRPEAKKYVILATDGWENTWPYVYNWSGTPNKELMGQITPPIVKQSVATCAAPWKAGADKCGSPIGMVMNEGAKIFVVAIGNGFSQNGACTENPPLDSPASYPPTYDRNFLHDIATASGGDCFNAQNATEMQQAFDKIFNTIHQDLKASATVTETLPAGVCYVGPTAIDGQTLTGKGWSTCRAGSTNCDSTAYRSACSTSPTTITWIPGTNSQADPQQFPQLLDSAFGSTPKTLNFKIRFDKIQETAKDLDSCGSSKVDYQWSGTAFQPVTSPCVSFYYKTILNPILTGDSYSSGATNVAVTQPDTSISSVLGGINPFITQAVWPVNNYQFGASSSSKMDQNKFDDGAGHGMWPNLLSYSSQTFPIDPLRPENTIQKAVDSLSGDTWKVVHVTGNLPIQGEVFLQGKGIVLIDNLAGIGSDFTYQSTDKDSQVIFIVKNAAPSGSAFIFNSTNNIQGLWIFGPGMNNFSCNNCIINLHGSMIFLGTGIAGTSTIKGAYVFDPRYYNLPAWLNITKYISPLFEERAP